MKKKIVLLLINILLLISFIISFPVGEARAIKGNQDIAEYYNTIKPSVLEVDLLSPDSKYEEKQEIILTFNFSKPSIEKKDTYDVVSIDDLNNFGNPGEPYLPIKSINVLLPPKHRLNEIEIISSERIFLKENIYVEPGHMEFPISDKNYFSEHLEPDSTIYNSMDPFPGKLYNVVGVQRFRGYDILVLNLHPVEYIPKEKKIFYYEEMTIKIKTICSPEENSDEYSGNSIIRGFAGDISRVWDIVDNPSIIDIYQNMWKQSKKSDFGSLSLVDPSDSIEYVIITTENLKNATGPYTFYDLLDSKIAKGMNATIVTIEDIMDNPAYSVNGSWGDNNISNPFYQEDVIYDYEKFNDTQAKIRNFIRDAYVNWGIEYVLIGGDDDVAPARKLYFGTYQSEEYHGPSDLYYVCLDGNYNSNEDNKWGESTDGNDGEDVDLFAEVYIGRACAGNSIEVSNFVYKTLTYLNVNNNLNDILMAGQKLDPLTWGGNYMDELINGSSANGYTTIGIPSEEYTINTLYDRDWTGNYWPTSEIINHINSGVHIINNMGHSGYSGNMKMSINDVLSLTNNQFCFIYSQGCNAGGFDYPYNDCIAEYFTVKTNHGAFAGIWNTRYGWYAGGSTNGPSQRFHRQFVDAIFGENIREIGKANQDSKEDNLWCINSGMVRWCYYELTLFGDPEISFKIPRAVVDLNVYRVKKIDPIEWWPGDQADWYYNVYCEIEDGEWKFFTHHCPEDNDDIIVNQSYAFTMNALNTTIKIKLMERDDWPGANDLADVSGYIGGGIDDSTPDSRGAIYYGYYDLINNSLTGDTTYFEGIYLTTSGEYPPDNSTSTDENDAKMWFKIYDNYELPIANIGSNRTVGVGEIVDFDASNSTGSLGSTVINYEWDWDNDRIYDESYQIPYANHSWTVACNTTVTLRVMDNYNQSSIDSCQIVVDPAKPVASFTYSPLHPNVNQTITFNASSSYDLDGIIISYEWDWNSDGIFDDSNISPIILHSFNTSGYKNVTLRVIDNDGQNDTYNDGMQILSATFTDNFMDFGIDTDSNSLYDFLIIEAELEVFEDGYYMISGNLRYYNDSSGWWYYFDYESNYSYLDVGVYNVSLEFDGYNIYSLGYNGSFKTNLYLYETTNWILLDDAEYITQSYNFDEFDRPPIEFTEIFNDYGLDINSDELYDYLVVEAEVNVTESAECSLSGSLYYYNDSSGWWNYFDYEFNYSYLDVGVYNVSLEFDGYNIYSLGYNGSFKVYLDLYDTINWNWIDDAEYITKHYDYTEFQRPIPDDYEPDNDYLNATLIAADGTQQFHDFHIQGDQDWLKFNANEDISYIIETSKLGIESDTYMYLYALDGLTEITHDDDGGEGLASRIIWDCNLSGNYYIKIRHYSSTACGPDTHYNISTLEWIPPAEFTHNFNDYGLDDDGNGFFDYLVIAAEINVSQAEVYYLIGELNYFNETDGTWDWFGCFAWNYSYLNIGIYTVLLEFNGHTINNLGYNGTFKADISLANSLYQLDYAEYYTSFYNYTDFQKPDTIPPNITDVHVPDYVGLNHPGNLSANISDSNLQLVSMMLYDYHNITFNQSIVIWYYLDDSSESGTYVVSEYIGIYANLNQTENSTPASLIMLSNWTHNDKVYILASFKKNQTAFWTQIFLEFNLSNGLLNNLAIPSISQLEYITNLIEPGVSIVYPFALIFNNGWTALDLNCNYTLYSIGDPNNPYLSFSPLENGEYTGLIQAQDTEYNINSASYNLSVNHSLTPNNPPNTPSNPYPANGSTSVNVNVDLNWTGGDPDLGDTVTYDVYFGTSNSPPLVVSNQSSTSYEPGAMNYNTTYFWKIIPWDNHGASAMGPIWSFVTQSGGGPPPPPPNQPPTAEANGPYFGVVDIAITFDGSGSFDPDGTITSYLWNLGDGNISTDQNPTHTYTISGNFTLTLTVTDNDGANDTDTSYVVIEEDAEPPSKVTGLTVTDAKDGKLNLAWTAATDNVAISHYKIYRDGVFMINSTTTSYQDTGRTNGQSYTYEVSAVDTSGNVGNKSDPASGISTASGGGGGPPAPPSPPSNNPPIANASAGEPYIGFVGEEITFDGSLSYDPDEEDIVIWYWNFGDGTNGTGETTTHIYTSTGAYVVTLIITDDDGDMDAYETTAVISQANRIPSTPDVDGPQNGTQNTEYTYTAVSTDEDNDTIQYHFDWDDGTNNITEYLLNGTLATQLHMWTSAGKYTIRVLAFDNQTPSDTTHYTIFIDAILVEDIGYITDDDADGTYDTFHGDGIETELGQEGDTYLIDTNGDGNWNYIYNPAEGLSDYKESEEIEIPWMMVVGIGIAIAIIAIIVYLYKKEII